MLTDESLLECGLTPAEAQEVGSRLRSLIASGLDGEDLWHQARSNLLRPEQPFALHLLLRQHCFRDWDTRERGPHPLWQANPERIERSNIAALMRGRGLTSYGDLYRWSVENGRDFWATLVRRLGVRFRGDYWPTPDHLVDLTDPRAPKWFPSASLNIVESCFSAERERVAIIYRHDSSEQVRHVTYAELDTLSNRIANALIRYPIAIGDRIAIDMPFNVEAIAVYLAVLKVGAVAVCLADSFRAPEIAIRLRAARPVRLLFTQDVTGGRKAFPLYPVVAGVEEAPMAVVAVSEGRTFAAIRARDVSLADFISGRSDRFEAIPVSANAPIALLFSSSTSTPKAVEGQPLRAPKAIPWTAATAMKSAIDAHLHHDLHSGKVLCWPTNLGWMMGSFAIFASMVNRGTLAVFDGSPSSREFTHFVEQAGVNVLGLVPTLAEAWQAHFVTEGRDWSSVELFSSTGSPSNPSNYFWLMSRVPGYAPCFEYMGGTELGGGYLTGSVFQPASPSCFTTPTLGTEIRIWPEDDANARRGEVFIVMGGDEKRCPPMGVSTSLLNGDHEAQYFGRNLTSKSGKILREHGDLVVVHPNGFLSSNGRADDGINLNGIKTSSLDLEHYIKDANIPGVRDVAAIAHRPPHGGEDQLVIFVVREGPFPSPTGRAPELREEIREAIKLRNPQLAIVHDVVQIEALPLTASGKLRRRYLQDLYREEYASRCR